MTTHAYEALKKAWRFYVAFATFFTVTGCSINTPTHIDVNKAMSQLVGISGMVRASKNSFVIVNDKKHGRHHDPRLGLITIEPDGYSYADIELSVLHEALPPNDLEAICAIPGGNGEYLLAESRFDKGKFGRIFVVNIASQGATWKAFVKAIFRPLRAPADKRKYSTPKAKQIEGIACLRMKDDQLYLVLVQRGNKKKSPRLIWGQLTGLETLTPTFMQSGQALFAGPIKGRGAADLYLKSINSTSWRIWTVATIDKSDRGPFRSVVYSPGIFQYQEGQGLRFINKKYAQQWYIDGLKVEALAAPTEVIPESILSIGSDDEHYGGIWRPLMQLEANSPYVTD